MDGNANHGSENSLDQPQIQNDNIYDEATAIWFARLLQEGKQDPLDSDKVESLMAWARDRE